MKASKSEKILSAKEMSRGARKADPFMLRFASAFTSKYAEREESIGAHTSCGSQSP